MNQTRRETWLFWLFAHAYFLIGFRNRLVVLMDWAWAYWSFARYARGVTGIVEPGGRAAQLGAPNGGPFNAEARD